MSPVEPSLLAELMTVRDFLAPTVDSAIKSLNIATGARVLDVGTGAGGALPSLARAVGVTGNILAVDCDSTLVDLASDYVTKMGVAGHVTVQLGDVLDVLTDAATTQEKAFDVIWAADSIYPVYFTEPADVVRQMAQALRPGGVIALFYPNYYNSIFLPGYSRLKRGLTAAAELNWGSPVDGPHHRERYLAWLSSAGLDNVDLTMLPRVCFPIDSDPTVRPYLEQALWPQLRKNASVYGTEVGLTAEEVTEIDRLLTPGDPHYIVDEPGYFVAVPAILATGRRPVGSP